MSASAVLKLQKVGFTAAQVEALAEFMDAQGAGMPSKPRSKTKWAVCPSM